MWNWFLGVDDFVGSCAGCSGRAAPTGGCEPVWANGEAGFAAYAAGALHTVQILTVEAGRVTRMTAYQDDAVFDLFVGSTR